MAYSDYGGRAWRNGIEQVDRSDCVITQRILLSTPGAWPGWTIPEGRAGMSFHAVLGDGPLYLTLYKQTYSQVFRGTDKVEIPQLMAFQDQVWGGIDTKPVAEAHTPTHLEFRVDGHRVDLWYTEEDNIYQYARMIQPDGVEWSGWAGYGVGPGLEDFKVYPYTDEDRNRTLKTLLESWP